MIVLHHKKFICFSVDMFWSQLFSNQIILPDSSWEPSASKLPTVCLLCLCEAELWRREEMSIARANPSLQFRFRLSKSKLNFCYAGSKYNKLSCHKLTTSLLQDNLVTLDEFKFNIYNLEKITPIWGEISC